MKATVSMEEVYTIEIRGRMFEGFKKVSEWEGMALFKNAKGQTVICDVSESPRFGVLAEIFGDTDPAELTIVKASQTITQQIGGNGA